MKTKRRLSKKEIEKKYHESASHPRRLIAYAIDWYLTSVLAMAPVIFFCSVETGKEVLTVDISLLSKNHAIIAFIVGLLLCLWYLVYLPNKNGQTFGKKIMGIKIARKDKECLTLKSLLIRNIIINGLGSLLTSLVCIFILPGKLYFIVTSIFGIIQILLVIISGFMVLYRKDKRGLQDIFSKTRVVLDK